jgi:hypothetical protein
MNEQQEKLCMDALNILERTVEGCALMFEGMTQSTDATVVELAEAALKAINHNMDTLAAMADSANAVKH